LICSTVNSSGKTRGNGEIARNGGDQAEPLEIGGHLMPQPHYPGGL
jgi:hypothetical protein